MQLIKLLEVKSIMSLGLVYALVWGFMGGLVSSEVFVGIVSSVVTYFFTRQRGNGNGH